MSMSYRSNILVKLSNKLVPDDVVKKVFNDTVSVVGIAIPTTVDGVQQVLIEHANLSESELDFTSAQKTMESMAMSTYLGSLTSPINLDNIQPFEVFKNPQGKSAAAAFLFGEYPGFDEEKSTHSPEFFFFNKYLRGKLHKIYTDCGQDINKFSDALRDQTLHTEIDAVAGKDHHVLVVSSNGALSSFENTNPYVRPWGWLADGSQLDVKEPIIDEKPVESTPSAPSIFSKKRTSTVVENPIHTEPVRTEPEPQKTDTKIPDEVPNGMVRMPVPEWITSNSDRKAWLERHGFTDKTRPKDWKDRTTFLINLAELTDRERTFLKKIGEPPEEKTDDTVITVTTTHVRSPGEPIVSKENIAKFHADFIQKDGLGQSMIDDPSKLQEQEARRQRWDDFKAGPLSNIANWDSDKLLYFIKEHPEMALIAILDLLSGRKDTHEKALEKETSAVSLFRKKTA